MGKSKRLPLPPGNAESYANLKQRFAASFLAGVFLFLAFPKFGSPWLAWVALLPLFWALHNLSPRVAFQHGLVTGLTAYTGIMYWIVYVVVKYGGLSVYAGVAVMVLLVAYLSVYLGLFSLLLVLFKKKGFPGIITAPVLWVLLEYLKSTLLTGFPWANLGHSQHSLSVLIQISDITSVYGVSFLIVFVNRAFFDLLFDRTLAWKRQIGQVGTAALLISTALTYGVYRMDAVNKTLSAAAAFPVSVIQGNIDQNIKWNPAYQLQTINIYDSLTRQAAPPPGGLVVWPETATPFYFQEKTPLSRRVLDLVQEMNIWLLFGSPSYAFKDGKPEFFNSAYLASPDGTQISKYDKVHLVPYGEYVPLRWLFPFLSKLVVGVGDFSSGESFAPLRMPAGALGVLICYEAIFPYAGRAYQNAGAGLFINITNDAWFGDTSAPYQHLSLTVFRAIENRKYLIRSANTGISAIINPNGIITHQTGLFEAAFISSSVKFINIKTFYGKYGDVFVLLCFLMILIPAISIVWRTKNAGSNVRRNFKAEQKNR